MFVDVLPVGHVKRNRERERERNIIIILIIMGRRWKDTQAVDEYFNSWLFLLGAASSISLKKLYLAKLGMNYCSTLITGYFH